MQNQIYPLNIDPRSPLKTQKSKPTFKQWLKERKRMFIFVLAICLITVGVIVYPFLNLQLFKGELGGSSLGSGCHYGSAGQVVCSGASGSGLGSGCHYASGGQVICSGAGASASAGTEITTTPLKLTLTANPTSIKQGEPITFKYSTNTTSKVKSWKVYRKDGTTVKESSNLTSSPGTNWSTSLSESETKELSPGDYRFATTVRAIDFGGGGGVGMQMYETGDPVTKEAAFTIASAGVQETEPTLTASLPSPQNTGVEITFMFGVTNKGGFSTGRCIIDFGDGTTSANLPCAQGGGIPAVHKYTTAGDYTVTAAAKSSDEQKTFYTVPLLYKYKIVTPITPILTIEPDPATPAELADGKVNVTFKLTAENITGPLDYYIDFGDGGKDFTSTPTTELTRTFTHKYTEEGERTVKAEAKIAGVVKASNELKYTIEPPPPPPPTCSDNEELVGGKCIAKVIKEICTNGKDDDDDDLVDYEDSDCKMPKDQQVQITKLGATKSKFNPDINAAKIYWEIDRDAIVTVDILDSSKEVVVTLLDSEKEQAKKKDKTVTQYAWFNGTVENVEKGQKLADGTYTYRVTALNPSNETIKTTKEAAIMIDSKDTTCGDWETGCTPTPPTPTSPAPTPPTTTPTNKLGNQSVQNMNNNPPSNTAGTGPETLIYLIFPALAALGFIRKNK